MDLNNREFRPNPQASAQHNEVRPVASHGHPNPVSPKKRGKLGTFKTGGALNVTYIFLLFSVTIVLVGAILALVFFKNTSSEERFVDTTKYQAIFLNNGQVYFGHIGALNKDYLRMSDIYYLRVNQQGDTQRVQPDQEASQQNDVSLVKLGCELHGPEDNMTINRDQVTFWENLKDDGQVAKAVADYKKTNPNGQNCEQQAQQQKSAPAKAKASDTPASTNDSGSTNRPSSSTGNNSDTPPAGN